MFNHHIKVSHIQYLNETQDLSTRKELVPTVIDQIKALSLDEDLCTKLTESLFPEVCAHSNVKKGLLLQLFGGTIKPDNGSIHFRSDIHILLCGDPATCKSQLLQLVSKIAPRAIYTSGKGSSSAGLTVAFCRTGRSGSFRLELGALLMCDGGICYIDEFDKMSHSTKGALNEIMEQQRLSVAKAGIVCALRAQTAVLAAANPKYSTWDHTKSIYENLNLDDSLSSRFDLIFLIVDQNDKKFDEKIARQIISMYSGGDTVRRLLHLELCKKCICKREHTLS